MAAQAGLDEFFAAVPEADPSWSLPDGVSVTFDLRGEGGGCWTISRDRGALAIHRTGRPGSPDSGAPDCRLRCSVSDFRALLRGELDARQGFLDGRLEVEGDVGLVLRLARANKQLREPTPRMMAARR